VLIRMYWHKVLQQYLSANTCNQKIRLGMSVFAVFLHNRCRPVSEAVRCAAEAASHVRGHMPRRLAGTHLRARAPACAARAGAVPDSLPGSSGPERPASQMAAGAMPSNHPTPTLLAGTCTYRVVRVECAAHQAAAGRELDVRLALVDVVPPHVPRRQGPCLRAPPGDVVPAHPASIGRPAASPRPVGRLAGCRRLARPSMPRSGCGLGTAGRGGRHSPAVRDREGLARGAPRQRRCDEGVLASGVALERPQRQAALRRCLLPWAR
jgi:hypothetical protein